MNKALVDAMMKELYQVISKYTGWMSYEQFVELVELTHKAGDIVKGG